MCNYFLRLFFFTLFIPTSSSASQVVITVGTEKKSSLEVAVEEYNIKEVMDISSSLYKIDKEHEKIILAALDRANKQKMLLESNPFRGAQFTTRLLDCLAGSLFAWGTYYGAQKAISVNNDLKMPLALLELNKNHYILSTLKKALFGESTTVKVLQDTNLIKAEAFFLGSLTVITALTGYASLGYFYRACMPLAERQEKLEKLAIIRHYLENILLKIKLQS
jgi:hypothetical protein